MTIAHCHEATYRLRHGGVGASLRELTASAADAVIELRRYALHPGERETLIELFDRELVEPQEAAGMRVLGQFRDLDHPDSGIRPRTRSAPSRAARCQDDTARDDRRDHLLTAPLACGGVPGALRA
jgi:hypothetical protein